MSLSDVITDVPGAIILLMSDAKTLLSRKHATASKATCSAPGQFRSPLRYPGGKQKAIAQIINHLPASFSEFREPMVGGGSVFFLCRSQNRASTYWINDKFHELATFWMVLQSKEKTRRLTKDLLELHDELTTSAAIKKWFLKAREEKPKDDYRTALLFFIFNRVTFSGTTRAGGFSAEAALKRFTVSSIMRLEQASQALDGVKITEGDFEKVINARGKDVFLFLDPPYYTATRLYGHKGDLHAFDHERLASVLKNQSHKFLITYDDCSDVRKLYSWCNIKQWQLRYGMNNCNLERTTKLGAELFISNY